MKYTMAGTGDQDFPSRAARRAYAEAERLVVECAAGKKTSLKLSGVYSKSLRALDRLPPGLAELPRLQRLILSNTRITDLTLLARLIRLERLTLHNIRLADLTPLARLAQLQRLGLSSTGVTDLAPLAGLTQLQTLLINGTSVTHLTPLARLRAMAEWAIAEDKTEDDRERSRYLGLHFSNCRKLSPALQDIAEIKDSKARTLAALNHIRAELGLSSVEDWLAGDEGPAKPIVPDQTEGLAVAVTSSGKLGLKPTGQPDEADLDQIAGLAPTLLAAAQELEKSCAGSNAFRPVQDVAARYRAVFESELSDISIDRLFAEGLWLGTANARLQDEIKAGDLPDQGVAIGASMDTLLSLHGIVIMGTKRGQLLLERSQKYEAKTLDIVTIKKASADLTAAIVQSDGIVEDDLKDVLEQADQNLAAEPHPERTTDVARTFQSNLLRGSAALIVASVIAPGVAGTEAAIAASGAITALVDGLTAFWLANQAAITGIAAAWGTDLGWVEATYRWLDHRRARQ